MKATVFGEIRFEDGAVFHIADYPIETEPPVMSKRARVSGSVREMIRMTVTAVNITELAAHFVNGAAYAVREYEVDENGELTGSYTDTDQSEYSVAGDIVDHRDGRYSVYMGKPTAEEQRIAELEAAGTADEVIDEMDAAYTEGVNEV